MVGSRYPSPPPPPERIRMRRSVWTLKQGAVVIEWPETILPHEAEEIAQFVDLVIKGIRRSAGEDTHG